MLEIHQEINAGGPLNEGLETGLAAYHFVKITEMTEQSRAQYQKVRQR